MLVKQYAKYWVWALCVMALVGCALQNTVQSSSNGKAQVDIADTQSSNKIVVGYVFSQNNALNPNDIAVEKLTHINYAFSNLENHRIVEGFEYDDQNYKQLQHLKQRNPELKILTSVGGWTWSGAFSDMAMTAESRTVFVNSVVDFIKKHQLDGIDIDWEYPGLAGMGNKHRPEDGANFTLLLQQLRAQLDVLEQELNRDLLITIASGGFQAFIDNSDIANWQGYLDFINIMAYDFHVPSANNITGHHTGLYTNPNDPTGLSADAAVRMHLDAGVPQHKLVLGVAFYGRSWMNVTDVDNGLYQLGTANNIDYGGDRFNNIFSNVLGKDGF